MENIVAKTRYSPVLAYAAVVRSLEVDWDQPSCLRWYCSDYQTADVREVPPTNHGGRTYPQTMFGAKQKLQREKLAKILASPGGSGSQAAPIDREEISPVVTVGDEMNCKSISFREKVAIFLTVDSCHRPSEKDMKAFV